MPHEPAMRTHWLWGWWALLVFLALGLVLESFHGFKLGSYLKAGNETRRLLWTLAHAHGTLLGLVNICFAVMLRSVPGWPESRARQASACLRAATVLMPAGFFAGGMFLYGGDPGLGILLVPAGGLLLLAAAALAASGVSRHFAPTK